MITVDLEKDDLVCLVKGISPTYKQMNNSLVSSNGVFNGSYGTWEWNMDAFSKNTEQEVYELYLELRNKS